MIPNYSTVLQELTEIRRKLSEELDFIDGTIHGMQSVEKRISPPAARKEPETIKEIAQHLIEVENKGAVNADDILRYMKNNNIPRRPHNVVYSHLYYHFRSIGNGFFALPEEV